MLRAQLFNQLEQVTRFDLAVIGGGATGLGVALDAAQRGFSVLLLESNDFAKGTSSRATKLVHGGVRYLAQGNIGLVREALHERSTLLHNAPHLTDRLAFVLPAYHWWELPFYGVGLKAYDTLAGKDGLGETRLMGRRETLSCLPTARPQGLKGGIKYWDGQFDDARLALALARTAAMQGALVINYCEVTDLLYDAGKLVGLRCLDKETGRDYRVQARCVVNATGVWADALRIKDGEAMGRAATPMLAPSQGVHLVVDREFLPTDHALMVPKTADGRVLFAVPWLGKTILGTTDTPRHDLPLEPAPFRAELDFILSESARYLTRAPTEKDIRSLWVGLRPLVKPQGDNGENTKTISREHTVLVAKSGLLTVTGGKWTTYRAMAEDVLDKCFDARLLPRKSGGKTVLLALVGAKARQVDTPKISDQAGLHSYGSEAGQVASLPGADAQLAGGLSEAMVRFAIRSEYARTVEDILARRSRLLFLDAEQAAASAPRVAEILREEGIAAPRQAEFVDLAGQYRRLP